MSSFNGGIPTDFLAMTEPYPGQKYLRLVACLDGTFGHEKCQTRSSGIFRAVRCNDKIFAIVHFLIYRTKVYGEKRSLSISIHN